MKKLLTFLFLFCSLLAIAEEETNYENYLIATVNGEEVTYPIDSPEDFEKDNHSASESDATYSFKSNNIDVSVARANVKSVTLEIPLTRAIKGTETDFCAYLFYNCTNLTEANITFSGEEECTSVGDSFCDSMFKSCESLVSLSDKFNLPQDITSVKRWFCCYMFSNCSSLGSLPDNFNLPQDITSVGDHFCQDMFYNCSSLVSLPDEFNLPQDITGVDQYFCYYMFYKCISLVSLPDGFCIPTITDYPMDYCSYMFYYCSNLTDGETVTLTFSSNTQHPFEDGDFSSKVTYNSENYTATLKGNSEVFYYVTYYDQNGEVIETQKIPNSEYWKLVGEEGDDVDNITIGEFAVDGIDLVQDLENYAFRGWYYESGKKADLEDEIIGNISLYALVTAVEKANGNSTYEYDLTDENFYAEDHECFNYDEDGNIVVAVGPEAYVVVETCETTNNYYYEEEDAQEITLTDDCISKITIYNVADYYKVSYYYNDELLTVQYIEPVENATIGEFAVDGTTLVDDSEGYAFRYWSYEGGKRATVEDVVSEDISFYPYITEIEKADGNSEYIYDLTDENFDYDLHDCISTTEDGDINITVGKDAYIIIGTTDETVTLKDAEGNTLDLETDDEGNLVYHYEGDDQADFTITATDGSVSKITIQNVADYYRHITYYDQYNEIIGTQKIEVDTQITEFVVTAEELTIEEGYAFRYWTYEDGKRATVEDVVSENISLYPYITEIEKADGNSTYEYDLTDENFYAEDHDCFNYDEDGNIVVAVGPEAYVVVETCETTNNYYYEEEDAQEITLTDDCISKITIYNVADYYKHITYYDQYNEIITTQKIEIGTQIGEFSVTVSDLVLDDTQVFVGWMYANGTEATVDDIVTDDIALYPIITSKTPTAISTKANSAELISVEYYDLDGKKLSEPQRGMNIVVESYSDGTQKSTKMLQK